MGAATEEADEHLCSRRHAQHPLQPLYSRIGRRCRRQSDGNTENNLREQQSDTDVKLTASDTDRSALDDQHCKGHHGKFIGSL